MRAVVGTLLAICLVGLPPTPADAALEVTIDTSGGSQTFSDADLDGIVDFNATIGGVLEASGRAKETTEGVNRKVTLAPTPPFSDGIFRNISAGPETYTVTVRSNTLAGALGPPLGWDLFYRAAVGDEVDFVVNVPTHFVEALANAGTIPLGTIVANPINSITPFEYEDHGVDSLATTNDAWIVWTFTLDPNDEMRVPFDGGFDGESIQVNVFNHSQKCSDKMNNGARKIGDRAQKSDAKCVKTSTADATLCVDAPGELKTLKKQDKLIDDFAAHCDPVPAWGVNSLSCCYGGGTNDGSICVDSTTCGGGICSPGGCIAEVAEAGVNELTHDLFGVAVAVGPEKLKRKCQNVVSKAVGRVYTEHWRVFRLCKRDNFDIISNDADLRSVCLEPEPDPNFKLQKREAKLADTIQQKCLGKAVTDLGTVFPGECTASSDATIAACFSERAACRFCRSVNYADAIVPPTDCDLFDDNTANASCPP
jgi:hypothetical protein